MATRTGRRNTARIEAQKPLLEKRLQLYIGVTSATATIATSKNQTEVAKAKDQFWNLYWGPLVLVEDPAVEHSMQQFSNCLQDSKKCDAPIADLARGLALSCNKSLNHDWAPNPPRSVIAQQQ
jgi:hypothetical protein